MTPRCLLANGSAYGLAADVFAGELRRALQLAAGIEAGMVGVNSGAVWGPSAPLRGAK